MQLRLLRHGEPLVEEVKKAAGQGMAHIPLLQNAKATAALAIVSTSLPALQAPEAEAGSFCLTASPPQRRHDGQGSS